jgi:uncharacterized membrane protein YsdA (DUF1294 family)
MRGSRSLLGITVAALFLGFAGVMTLIGKLTAIVFWGYLVASAVCFLAYAVDKSAARAGRWRTSEQTLHLLALLGGWPGALIAQNLLRHKSQKTGFLLILGATVVINCGALVWLISANDWPPIVESVAGFGQIR